MLLISLAYEIIKVVCGQFAYRGGLPVDDDKLHAILEEFSTDPIYKNIFIDLVGHVYMFVA